MPHIQLKNSLPGIIGLMDFSPETAKPLLNLAQTLLRGNSTLEIYERELIATYVSRLNDCNFCMKSHGAVVNELVKDKNFTSEVLEDFNLADISPKLKALLNIAGKVQKGGRKVEVADIDLAKQMGALDEEIHDTVLIAAAFCMYNRYVDGLQSLLPKDESEYVLMGKRLVEVGYS